MLCFSVQQSLMFWFNTCTFQHGEFMTSHLSVVRLHMRNVGVSFREPLETLPTRPAGGLHTRSVILLCLFSGAICVFNRAVTLLLLDGMSILVPVSIACLFTAFHHLCGHASCMNTLQNRKYMAKVTRGNKIWNLIHTIGHKLFNTEYSSFTQQYLTTLCQV